MRRRYACRPRSICRTANAGATRQGQAGVIVAPVARAQTPIDIHWSEDPDELSGAIEVRTEVFCVEQGVPVEEEIDGRDDEAAHVVALDHGRVVATLRLLVDGEQAKVGRVAVLRDWRRRKIAQRMLEMAIDAARERGCTRASLASQVYATELYERAGFAVDSDVFEEAGMPHVWMRMAL